MEQYSITGMSCAACQARIEKAVSRVEGVTECSVSLLTNSMGVEGTAASDDIIKAVVDAGYGASLKMTGFSDSREAGAVNPSLTSENELKDTDTPRLLKRLIASVILLVPLMYVSMGHMMLGWPVPALLEGCMASGICQMLLAGVVMVINQRFFISGFKGAVHGAPNMDTLVAMGSAAAFCYSVYALLAMAGAYAAGDVSGAALYMNELYFESAAMILALITVGKTLESKSKGRTTDAIKALMRLSPKSAVVIREGQEVTVPIGHIRVGDDFLLRAGENVPVDGVVISGTALVDESALTGESAPVRKNKGDTVSAATTSMSGRMVCRATRVGEDTTLSQIIKLVTDAAATKAPIARIADRVSGVFVPAVLIIAAVTFISWMLAGQTVGFSLARAISVLVVSCPCALGLATPVAIMVGNGVGARCGILFKTAQSLELAGRADIVALDKTGTITKGLSGVTGIDPDERVDTATDEIKEDSPGAIRALRDLGVHVVMVSGDKEETARRIAQKAGVDEVVAGVLPGGKDAVIKELRLRPSRRRGRAGRRSTVIMVGDGINDGPALTAADVGMAIGAGTDVAIDAADIVLERSSLLDVVTAIRLSRSTLRNIHQNLFWAFFYNILLIPLAAGVYTPLLGWTMDPMLGAAAMSLSSFCVVMNALRLNLFKAGEGAKLNDDLIAPPKNDDIMTSVENDDLTEPGENDDLTSPGEIDNIKSESEDKIIMEITVKGMMCQNCERHVKEAIEKISGVKSVAADHENDRVVITSITPISEDEIRAAVEEAGYEYVGINP